MSGLGRAPLLGRLTASARALPDFLVIGAQRSGTTVLFDALSQHPDVRAASRKEVHYFDLNHGRGVAWYRAFFPLRRRGGVVGEATPYYLAHPLAADRAAAALPDLRLVAILREPVDRAWSHWRWNTAAGREHLSFAEALRVEDDRLRGEEARLLAGDDASDQPHQHVSYLERGRYANQLDRWSERFPAGALVVVRHEDLVGDADRTLTRVHAHLGLSGAPVAVPKWTPGGLGPTTDERALAAELLGDAPAQLKERYGIRWDPPIEHDQGLG